MPRRACGVAQSLAKWPDTDDAVSVCVAACPAPRLGRPARGSSLGRRPVRRLARRPSLGRRQQLLVQNGRTETTCHAFWTIRPPKWSLSGHSAKEVAFKRPFCKRSLCPPSSVPSLFGLRPRCRPYRGGRPLPGITIVRTSHAEDASQLPPGDSGVSRIGKFSKCV